MEKNIFWLKKINLTFKDPELKLSERGNLDVGHTNSRDISIIRLILLLVTLDSQKRMREW